MSTPTDAQRMEKIVSLCKRRGFIFQSSDIYGGLNGAWDYGPLGVELKRNLKNYWWRVMVHERDDVVGMDRKSTRLNSSHRCISYAVFCLKKKKTTDENDSKHYASYNNA